MGRALNVLGVPTGAATFSAALEGLTSLDEAILRASPGLPRLAVAGVRYSKEDTSKWRTIDDILSGRNGPKMAADCEALAPWLAAERRVYDGDADAQVLVYPSGGNKFHAVVLRGDGTIEDPSVALGMKAPAALLDGYRYWNQEVAPRMAPPMPDADAAVLGFDDGADAACVGVMEDGGGGAEITFDVERTPEGFRGHFRLPFVDGRALFGRTSPSQSPEEAEQKATNVLGLVGAFWDDVAALVPGGSQAQAALRLARNQHVQNIATAAYGKAKSVFSHGGGGQQQQAQQLQQQQAQQQQAAFDGDGGSDAGFWGRDPDSDDDSSVDGVDRFHGKHGGREEAIIGYINATLAAGSRPTVGAMKALTAAGGSKSAPASSSGGGMRVLSSSAGGGSSTSTATPRQMNLTMYPPGTTTNAPPGSSPVLPGSSTYVNPYTGQPYGSSPYAPSAPGYGPAGSLPGYGQSPPPGLTPQQRQNWLQYQAQQMTQQAASGGGSSSGGGGGGDYGPPSYDYGGGGGADYATPGGNIDAFYGGYNMPDAEFQQNAALAQQIAQSGMGEDDGVSGFSDPDDFHGGEQEFAL
jgi:hypothetical protein